LPLLLLPVGGIALERRDDDERTLPEARRLEAAVRAALRLARAAARGVEGAHADERLGIEVHLHLRARGRRAARQVDGPADRGAPPEHELESLAPLLVAELELEPLALERALLLRDQEALARGNVLEREDAVRVGLRLRQLLAREAPDRALGGDDLGLRDGLAALVAHGAGERRSAQEPDLARAHDSRLELQAAHLGVGELLRPHLERVRET